MFSFLKPCIAGFFYADTNKGALTLKKELSLRQLKKLSILVFISDTCGLNFI